MGFVREDHQIKLERWLMLSPPLSPLLTSTSLCPILSFLLRPFSCLPHLSPAFTSSLPPLPLRFLIPQANGAPKDVTCQIMSAKSLCHLHHTVGENKQDSYPPSLLKKKVPKKKI